jgi:hypothetical protein
LLGSDFFNVLVKKFDQQQGSFTYNYPRVFTSVHLGISIISMYIISLSIHRVCFLFKIFLLYFEAVSVDTCVLDDRSMLICYQDQGSGPYSQADTTCRGLGGRLPYIQTSSKVQLLNKYFSGQIWTTLRTDSTR